ncbi:ATP-binding protein [Marinomonas ostreistagni]|uniref:ATP-binding protein n=1 Tax=Marinomonas ostreistagni TaxID=359209 RepID=UPI00194EDB4F|nr:ATP-binding protein [Marinomonas ostreistagni]MBM6550271.1 sensor histidine kinase N-terminal domain-containing protein [Marinomonas ostreistagni]
MLEQLGRKLPNSIKKRTLFLVMFVFALTSFLLGIVSIFTASHEVEELFDARLAQQARLLVQLTGDNLSTEQKSTLFVYPDAITESEGYQLSKVGHQYESKVYFRIWHDGKVVVSSDQQVIEPDETAANGFGYADSEHYEWRTFELIKTLPAGTLVRIVVAERLDVRGEMVTEIVLNSVLPEVVGWPLIALFVWFAVSIGLEPLKQLTDRIRSIEAAKLEPVSLDNVPAELAPVQQALNSLLQEIDDLMAREKRWIADAAHELRTPLTVLKLHAQNAEFSASDEERQQALLQLRQGVDRSTRIVAQLLSYARVESQLNAPHNYAPLDVLKETRRIIAQLYPMAWDKGVNLEVAEQSQAITLLMADHHLEVILQNLISNAIKFTPSEGMIEVCWLVDDTHITLECLDTGVGVSEADFERLTERFYRGADLSGAGLGLSIVATLANHYDAEVIFEHHAPQGLIVRVIFPVCGH